MMKKGVICSLATLVLGTMLCGTVCLGAVANETHAVEVGGYETENVAREKRVEFTDKDGQAINSEFLKEAHGPGTHGEGEWDPYAALTDGDNDPNQGHPIVSVADGNNAFVLAFAVLDLGQSYTITSFGLNFWHDHVFGQIVLQVSENKDFSNAVTVFNNDTSNMMGQGAGQNGLMQNVSNTTVKLATSPVQGRYVRVSGRSQGSGAVYFSEFEVYAVTGGDAPVTGNLAYEYQSADSTLTLASVHSGAKIYYTTDGSWPTASSTPYTGPIALSSVLGSQKLIRAVAIKEDGTATLPSDFRFSTSLAGQNLALGLKPYFDEEELESVTFKGINDNNEYTHDTMPENYLTKVTDGKKDTTVPGTKAASNSGDGVWLYLDLGAVYPIDKVAVDFWHDWAFGAVIQLSTSPDFPAGDETYTVYSNYQWNITASNITGFWEGMARHGADIPMTENGNGWYKLAGASKPIDEGAITFETVQARYFRVFCTASWGHAQGSGWSEIQIYSADESYPEAERAITKVDNVTNFSVPFGSEQKDFAGKLPTTVQVEDFFGNQGTITGTWACETYNKEQAGDYEFKFTPSEGNAFGDPYGVLNVTVTVAPAADKTGLKTAIERASVLKQEEYLADHWQEFADALQAANAVDGKELLFQSEVDSAKTALENAMSALIKKGDKTALNSLLSTVNGLQENKYSKKSWAALQTAKAHATEVQQNESATQSAVDLAVTELQNAYNALEELGDKTALTQKVNELKALDLGGYTSASKSVLESAISDAEELLKKEEIYKAEAESALQALDAARSGLVEKADFSALENAVNDAQRRLRAGTYTASTLADLEEEVQAAQAVLDNDGNTQETVDAALASLNAKLSALVSSDKTELNELLAECTYKENGYTASSWNAYVEAKQAAQAISADEEAAQTEIDDAKTKLQAAVDGLTELGDKTKLNAAIAEADAVTLPEGESDEKSDFTQALEYAKSVAASNDVSQADVDEAENMLKTAQAALENGQDPDDGKGNETQKGCGGVVSAGVFGVAALGAVAFVLRKRKESK